MTGAFLFVSTSTLSGNVGGAIWNEAKGAVPTLVSLRACTLTGNTAGAQAGAAVRCDGGPNTFANAGLENCTLRGNDIYARSDTSTMYATVSLASCILKDSPLINGGFAQIYSNGNDLSNDNGNGFLTSSTDQINIDPLLDPLGLQNNGGQTQTIALTSGSPAIDKGINYDFGVDQRGVAVYDNPSIPNASGGDGSDIGAYEVAQGQDPVQGGTGFVVTTTDDHDDGVCGGSDCTLREAVTRANNVPGASSIIFAHGLTGSITLTQGELVVTDSLTVTGAPIGTISGNGVSRVFSFTGGSSYLSELTIRDGRNQILLGSVNNGGGIYNGATLHVYGCSFLNNRVLGANALSPSAASGGAGQGGGIYNSGTLFLDGATFGQTNQASGGNGGNGNGGHGGVASGSGGAGHGGAVFNDTSGSLFITNCTFNGNVALGGNGGSGGPAGGNGGNGSGGAIYNLGAITITSATISGNSGASGTPGTGSVNGVFGVGIGGMVAAGTATMANTISAGNTGSNGGGGDAHGLFVSSGYNLIGIGDFGPGFTSTGDQVGTTAAPINPGLGPLQNNGGGTNTMALLSNSPAIDQGKSFGLAADQRGHERPFDAANISNATGGDGSDIGAFELGGTLVPINAMSRQTHGVAGPFDIPLPLTNSVGVECRSGGATGDYQIVLTFAAPVTVTGNPQAQITSGIGQIGTGGTSNGGVVSVNGAIVIVPLTNVANAQRITLTLSGASDGANTNNVTVSMGVLLGDTNGDAFVNAGDAVQTRSRAGQGTNTTNFRSDVNADGFVNSGDTTVVRTKSGTSLP